MKIKHIWNHQLVMLFGHLQVMVFCGYLVMTKNTQRSMIHELREWFPQIHPFHPINWRIEGSIFVFWLLHFQWRTKNQKIWSSLSQWTLKKKSLNFIFPTKYVIAKSLKFSHWPSKAEGKSSHVPWRIHGTSVYIVYLPTNQPFI